MHIRCDASYQMPLIRCIGGYAGVRIGWVWTIMYTSFCSCPPASFKSSPCRRLARFARRLTRSFCSHISNFIYTQICLHYTNKLKRGCTKIPCFHWIKSWLTDIVLHNCIGKSCLFLKRKKFQDKIKAKCKNVKMLFPDLKVHVWEAFKKNNGK